MSHIFISYARRDIDFAQKIVDALAENNLDTWIDLKSIPKGENWEKEIDRGIEEADAFLFLISPDSVKAEGCEREIKHAVNNGKRILPIVIRDTNREIIPTEISKRNWIFCRDGQDDFNKAIKEIHTAIHTNYEWLRYHTELQVKALKWDQEKDASRLLRGKELKVAEQQLSNTSAKDPQPTDLQRQYLLESQRWLIGMRNLGLVTGAIVIVALTFLSVFAFTQRNTAIANENSRATAQANAQAASTLASNNAATAQANANIAIARQLAVQAKSIDDGLNSRKMFAILLATESMNIFPSSEAAQTLINNKIGTISIARMIHDDKVWSVAFSPDGKYVVSGSDDNTARIWEVSTGKEVARISHDEGGWVTSAYFSPDGRFVVSVGGCVAEVWDATTGKEIAQMNETTYDNDSPGCSMDYAIFSPDGKYVLSNGASGCDENFSCTQNIIRVWDAATGKEITQKISNLENMAFAFSPNGKYVLSRRCDQKDSSGSCIKGSTLLWEALTGKEVVHVNIDSSNGVFSPNGEYVISTEGNSIHVWKAINGKEISNMTHEDIVSTVAFSPDGKYVVSGSFDDTVRVWEALTGKEVIRMTHDELVREVAFSPDGKYVVSGSDDNTARVWNASTGIEVARMTHDDNVKSVAFSPDGKYVVSGSDDRTVRVWEAVAKRETSRVKNVSHISFSPDGKYVLSISEKNTIVVWELATDNEIAHMIHEDQVVAATFSPDGRYVVSGSHDHTARVWEVATGKEVARMTHDDLVVSVAFSPDGKYVVSGSFDNTARVWEALSGKEIARMTHDDDVRSVAFNPDGKYVVSSSDDRTARVWEAATGKEIARMTHGNTVGNMFYLCCTVETVAFSPDGKQIASGGIDQIVHVWEAATGNEMFRMKHAGGILIVTFSPDGKYLASGSDDNTARIWETSTGVEISLMTHDKPVTSLAFSLDGKYVISGSSDNTARVWDVSTGLEVARKTSDDALWYVEFSPDGKYAVSGNKVWLWKPTDLISNACAYLPRNLTRAEWKQYIGDALPYQAVCPNLPAEPEAIMTPPP